MSVEQGIRPSPLELESFAGRPVDQIGIVVRDLFASLERYSKMWSLGRWDCYLYGPDTVQKLEVGGQPANYSMWIALNEHAPQIELIQPLTGPSVYADWLENRGEGIHHLGVFVESLKDTVATVEGAGYRVLQAGYGTGVDGSGGYAYLDTVVELGAVLEAIEIPRRRRAPDRVWTADSANTRSA